MAFFLKTIAFIGVTRVNTPGFHWETITVWPLGPGPPQHRDHSVPVSWFWSVAPERLGQKETSRTPPCTSRVTNEGTGIRRGMEKERGAPPVLGNSVLMEAGVLGLWDVNGKPDGVPVLTAGPGGGPSTHVELLAEHLAVVGRAGPDLFLQPPHRDGEVLLGPRRGPAEKHHSLLLYGIKRNTGHSAGLGVGGGG